MTQSPPGVSWVSQPEKSAVSKLPLLTTVAVATAGARSAEMAVSANAPNRRTLSKSLLPWLSEAVGRWSGSLTRRALAELGAGAGGALLLLALGEGPLARTLWRAGFDRR